MAAKTGGSVRLTVELPKGVARFVADLSRFGGSKLSLKEWAEAELVDAADATIDQIHDSQFIQGPFLREKYGLQPKQSETSNDP